VISDRGARVTIETERVLLMVRRQSRRGWCKQCGQEVDLVGIGRAEMVLDRIPLEGRYQSETRLHLKRAREGLAVCLKSLLQAVRGTRGQ